MKVVHVYDFYDEPVLYVAEADGTLYLCLLVDESRWLCAPMSAARHDAIANGHVDFLSAFLDVEGGAVIAHTGTSIEWVDVSTIDLCDLPVPGEYA